jgi:D-psicose/D-tagatose/L-ribulose 3-epimerase
MPRFGAHAFIWEATWDDDSASRAVRAAKEAGLDFIEIPVLRPGSIDADATRRRLADAGLEATCSLGLPAHASFPDRTEAAIGFLTAALDLASRVGSPLLTGVTYGSLGVLPGRSATEEERDAVAAGLRRVARHAATLGLALGVEPVNRYESHMVNLARQGLDLIDRIGEPNVFLHLDTYHMNIEEKGYRDPILRCGSRLRYIHLSESDRGVPGSGNVRWDDVFAALAEIAYGGDLVLESFVAVNPDIARATCVWRELAPSSEVLVAEGLTFLRGLAVRHGLVAER